MLRRYGRARVLTSSPTANLLVGADDPGLDAAVTAHATVPDWAERDDVRRDIRGDAMRALLNNEKTRSLVSPSFLDELMSVATTRQVEA